MYPMFEISTSHREPVSCGAVKLDKPATSGYIMLLEGEFDPVDMSREAFLYVDSRRVAMSPQVDRSYRFDEIEPGTYTLLALIYPDESVFKHRRPIE